MELIMLIMLVVVVAGVGGILALFLTLEYRLRKMLDESMRLIDDRLRKRIEHQMWKVPENMPRASPDVQPSCEKWLKEVCGES